VTAPPTRRVGPARPASRYPLAIAAVVVLAILLAFALSHRANRYERMAEAVTKAIAANNMVPAEKYFNAINYRELHDRARVGALSNLVAEHGALKRIKEDTPAGSSPDLHTFTATFDRGALAEKFQLDAEGKIVKFHIGEPATTP